MNKVQTIIAALRACGNDGESIGCKECPYKPNSPECLSLTYRAAELLQAAYQEG